MANNRLWLKCKQDGAIVKLASYGPACGWFADHDDERLDRFFQSHSHVMDGAGGGEFVLVYDVGGDNNEFLDFDKVFERKAEA